MKIKNETLYKDSFCLFIMNMLASLLNYICQMCIRDRENIQWSVIFSKKEKGTFVLIDGVICRGMPFYDEVEYFKVIRGNMRLGIYERFQKTIKENRDDLYLRSKSVKIKKVYMAEQRSLSEDSIENPSTVQEIREWPYLEMINSMQGECKC